MFFEKGILIVFFMILKTTKTPIASVVDGNGITSSLS